MFKVNILLFDDFETLDVFGPVEIFGVRQDLFEIEYISLSGYMIQSAQKAKIKSKIFRKGDEEKAILLIPGGPGTRDRVDDVRFIEYVKKMADECDYVLSVCTGAALLAKAGLLNGKHATSNKRAFDWVMTQGPDVQWVKKARWVVADQFYTSSGVSAGMDMTLAFVEELLGYDEAIAISNRIEYRWNQDASDDPFAALYE